MEAVTSIGDSIAFAEMFVPPVKVLRMGEEMFIDHGGDGVASRECPVESIVINPILSEELGKPGARSTAGGLGKSIDKGSKLSGIV